MCQYIQYVIMFWIIFSDDGSKAVQLNDEQADWKQTKLLYIHKGDLTYTYYFMLHTTDYHLHVHKGDHTYTCEDQMFSL